MGNIVVKISATVGAIGAIGLAFGPVLRELIVVPLVMWGVGLATIVICIIWDF